ncbi:amidohydrolase family protein [Actinomadura nitritigenes]|uniref:amidohydrolase family protein n=1 Tax=Actinomadura nitritigenes TaxID=134602 RepID=UPI003D8FA7D3
MIDDVFVFDLVVHLHDMSEANLLAGAPWARHVRNMSLGLGEALRPLHGDSETFDRRLSAETMGRMVFGDPPGTEPTDIAMAQVVPVFDWYDDWWAPVDLQAEFARAFPGRALFCGGVDPGFRGVEAALEHLEWQVIDRGAVSLKFYNGHVDRGWRCDDEKLAYPLYERARDLGIDVLQFHKGNPFGTENLEQLHPGDLQRAARDFPDLTFVIHHLAMPYFDECVNIAARFPNIHLALSATVNFTPVRPRLIQRQVGELLATVGADRLLWGSEAALAGPPRPYLEAFMALQIPDDLREGYGYPQITKDDKRKILGLNAARLFGVDVPDSRSGTGNERL